MVRQLQFARVRRDLAAVQSGSLTRKTLATTSASDDETLKDGHMRLYAFYTPALEAGPYTVSASQVITAYKEKEAQTRTIQNQYLVQSPQNPSVLVPGKPVLQTFNVVAPQFSLDPALVNSFYPPPGHQDEGRVLPHIVFNDPHVPWLRDAGQSSAVTNPIAGGPAGGQSWAGRSRVPWMALLVFKPEDLRLGAGDPEALGISTLDAWVTGTKSGTKPPADGVYKLQVSEFLKLPSRVRTEDGMTDEEKGHLATSTDKTSIIFPRKEFVINTFSNDGTGTGSSASDLTPLNALQLMAHVRHVNTKGMPDTDPTLSPDAYYSVVVSSMTGDVTEAQLTTHIVHLVSIENVDATIQAGMTGPTDRVAMVSLFSWTYSCIPESADFATTMEALARSSQPLRAPDQAIQVLDAQITSLKQTETAKKTGMTALRTRLEHGYTLSRWRDALGEESMAFMRGPLVPKGQQSQPRGSSDTSPAPHLPGGDSWPVTSMTGKNYMIIDKSVGVFDVTYSAAWSLGKLMAISDGTFTAALTRLRGRTRTTAVSTTLSIVNNLTAKRDILHQATQAVRLAHDVIKSGMAGDGVPVSRLVPAPVSTGPKSLHDPGVKLELHTQIATAVQTRSMSLAGSVWTGLDGEQAVDSDWELVSNWIHDALFLAKMPAHHLFPDPSFLRAYLDPANLPADSTKMNPEALRFFSIDDAWIDCYIDGALSCSNHLDPQHDTGRLAIKTMINTALATGGPNKIPLPVPRSGFVLRSSVVKVAPDIKVTVTRFIQDANQNWVEDTTYDPLLRHTRLDEFTILCLLDIPLDQVHSITMAQPPHQQRFAFPGKLVERTDPNTNLTTITYQPEMLIQKLYTNEDTAEKEAAVADPPGAWAELDKKYQIKDTDKETGFYNMTARRINADEIARKVVGQLTQWNTDQGASAPYTDPIPDSCVLGMQLNDPCYQLVIKGSPPTSSKPYRNNARQLWVGPLMATTNTSRDESARALALRTLGSQLSAQSVMEAKKPESPKPVTLTVPAHRPADTTPVCRTQRLLLNRAAVIPASIKPAASGGIPAQRKSRSPTAWPPADTPDAQFELLLHPDYRPPPPRPSPPYHAAQSTLYSPQTIIPISPTYLYDLILAIRRRPGPSHPGLLLQKLYVELPIEDNTDARPPSANFYREPLLLGGSYAGTKISMAGGNQRFVPTLESAAHSTDDGQACIRVTLVPRSGKSNGMLALAERDLSAQLSVRLGEVRIAGVVDNLTTATIATYDGGRQGRKGTKCGRCFVKMTEVYGTGQERYSWATVLKSDDADPRAPKA